MIKGLELKEGMFLQLTGMEVKCQNDIFIVDCDYNEEEYAPYCHNEYCLEKVKINGELKTSGTIGLFLNERVIEKNPNMSVKIVTNLKEAKKEVDAYLKGIKTTKSIKEEIIEVAPVEIKEIIVEEVKTTTESNKIVRSYKIDNFEIATVLKNEVREMIVIRDENNKSMYGWIEGKILTIVDLNDYEEEKLFLTRNKLEELFPTLIIGSHIKMEWNDISMTAYTVQLQEVYEETTTSETPKAIDNTIQIIIDGEGTRPLFKTNSFEDACNEFNCRVSIGIKSAIKYNGGYYKTWITVKDNDNIIFKGRYDLGENSSVTNNLLNFILDDLQQDLKDIEKPYYNFINKDEKEKLILQVNESILKLKLIRSRNNNIK